MSIIYFDLTNIVRFAQSNDHVTGIQRVQLRLITDMLVHHGAELIKGLTFIAPRGGWQLIDLRFLLEQPQFNAQAFLLATGQISPSRFPSADQIKRRLAPYNDRKLLRSLKKLEIYAIALVSSNAIRERGFRIYSAEQCTLALRCQPLKRLAPGDVLAILGESGANVQTERKAKEHHDSGGTVVQLIHDLIPIVHRTYHTERTTTLFTNWLSRSMGHVSRFICVSDNTARDLARFMETKGCGAPVDVVPLAHEFAGYARRAVLPEPRQLKGQAYVLCVGSIEVRKNGLALLKAWIKVRDELGDRCPQLVFAGKYGWMIEEFHALLAATRHVHGTVTIVESPSDDELARLYRHCLFTVYPSLYEGWGLPVGEAAWFGKFGVVSRESSLPEVCGDLMDYIDPGSPSDIAAKIIRPLTDAAYLSMRTQRIEAAPLRTWTQVAEDFHRHLQPNRTVHASRATISSAE